MTLRRHPGAAVAVALLLASAPGARALDTGVLDHFLNVNVTLPALERAVPGDQAVDAVKKHIAAVLDGSLEKGTAMAAYWKDYREVLKKYPEPSTAKPVLIKKADGTVVVARYLVGLKMNGPVGGFFAVDPETGDIMARLMWNPALKPLWMLPESTWNAAASVNDLPELKELVPPYDQFTSGVPVDPHDPTWTIVDGVVDVMPLKTQEERIANLEEFNNDNWRNPEAPELKATQGRRMATSKCMSVAASYLGDWWAARTGHLLPTYKNAAGGQKEYGYNPRLVESIFLKRRADAGIGGKWLGDFKTAPFSVDRVTGEGITYSPRGYARVLAETDAGTIPEPLLPKSVSYPTEDNHFRMDRKPLLFQIFLTGLFPRMSMRDDLRDATDPSFPFSLAPNYGEPVTLDALAQALDTWGPMLGQHQQRSKSGASSTGRFGTGVHAVQIVGTGRRDGKDWVVYRETFGDTSHRYLEDSFVGPPYRAMPVEYFYEALAFPHHLYLSLGLGGKAEAGLTGELSVTTNRRLTPIDPDQIHVFVDGTMADQARITPTGRGTYKVWLPGGTAVNAQRVEVRATKKYFADATGNGEFSAALERQGDRWVAPQEPAGDRSTEE